MEIMPIYSCIGAPFTSGKPSRSYKLPFTNEYIDIHSKFLLISDRFYLFRMCLKWFHPLHFYKIPLRCVLLLARFAIRL